MKNLSSSEYWNNRYKEKKLEGSGAGSAHEFAQFKSFFINCLLKEHKLQSVYDYGCGNARVLRSLDAIKVFGYDFSQKAIDLLITDNFHDCGSDHNRSLPKFMTNFDCVLCLEVLFHNTDDVKKNILTKIYDAKPKMFICCDIANDNKDFKGSHISQNATFPLIEAIFSGYKVAKRIQFREKTELIAYLRE